MNETQANVILVAAPIETDGFKPFETRVLSAGKYEIKAIKPKGVSENRVAWRSWAEPFPTNWGDNDCDPKSHGWTTDFYISVLDLYTNEKKPVEQFTSTRCRTKEIAVQNAQPKYFTIDNLSIVTFFLSAKFDDPRYKNDGGLVLFLRKV